ncbi:MAG: YraN family protein, partial [Clostridia bacterium]|nr:YraN family protein [Clostridia bacterium]
MNSKLHDEHIKERGRQGEKLVCAYLEQKGYKIVCTNYHSRYGEIDIIAENDSVIAFVEVKTRKTNSLVSGLESINSTKIRKIVLTLLDYI